MSFIDLPIRKNSREITSDIDYLDYIIADYRRLLLLENGVVNYSGGWSTLEKRARTEMQKLINTDDSAALLMHDIADYLQAIAIAGKLQEKNYHPKQSAGF